MAFFIMVHGLVWVALIRYLGGICSGAIRDVDSFWIPWNMPNLIDMVVSIIITVGFGVLGATGFGISFALIQFLWLGRDVGNNKRWVPATLSVGLASMASVGISEALAWLFPTTWAFIPDAITILLLVGIILPAASSAVSEISDAVPPWIALGIPIGLAIGIRLCHLYPSVLVAIIGVAFGASAGMSQYPWRAKEDSDTLPGNPRLLPFLLLFGIPFGIVVVCLWVFQWQWPLGWFAIFVSFGGGCVAAFLGAITYSIIISRAYYSLLNCLFVWPCVHGAWYPWHPVAWDDQCLAYLPRLDSLLVAYGDVNPERCWHEIDRLIGEYPSQSAHALRARSHLAAKEAAHIPDLMHLSTVIARFKNLSLPKLTSLNSYNFKVYRGLLSHWENATRILDLYYQFMALDRPIDRVQKLTTLFHEIEAFKRDSPLLFRPPLSDAFQAAAQHWHELLKRQRQRGEFDAGRLSVMQPFLAHFEVDIEHNAFVARWNTINDLNRHVTEHSRCPGVVLYGRRRVGKSTVLHNLRPFMPDSTVFAVLDLVCDTPVCTEQALVSKLLHKISQAVLFESDIGQAASSSLSELVECLAAANRALEEQQKHLVIALDEYEAIDVGIRTGRIGPDFLTILRSSIDAHSRIAWVFCGSHKLSDLDEVGGDSISKPNARRWTSHLVSAITVDVLEFTEAESRLLLTEPFTYSTDSRKRVRRFDDEFWGAGGVEHIHSEAGGWPHLVQLIAQTIVDTVNDYNVRVADPKLREHAIERAVDLGADVIDELLRREGSCEEWEYLRRFRDCESQRAPADERIARSILRRRLVVAENGEWRLRVPFMRRWLRHFW
jgi:hypothetical protein